MFVLSNSFLPSLLPQDLIEGIENEKVNEQSMLAVSTLISNIVLGAIKAWEQGAFKKLDPNPGDGGCQLRGYLLSLFLADQTLREEATLLKKQIEKVKDIVNKRNVFFRNKKNESPKNPGSFFKEQFENCVLSKKMEYILQCHLLAVTRACSGAPLPNGILLTKTDAALLSKLSKNIADVPVKYRQKIIEVAQAQISENSVELLSSEAEKLASFESEEKGHLLFMLSNEMRKKYSPNPERYQPKTFGCLFYEYKAILYRLREEKAIVCFKSIVPKGEESFRILLQPEQAGGEFSIFQEDLYHELDSTPPIIVFEGVVRGNNKPAFSEKIVEIGWTNLILAAAAIEPPYERKSDLSELKNERAQEEIVFYRQFAEKIECQKGALDPLLILDHVYCNSVRAEVGSQA